MVPGSHSAKCRGRPASDSNRRSFSSSTETDVISLSKTSSTLIRWLQCQSLRKRLNSPPASSRASLRCLARPTESTNHTSFYCPARSKDFWDVVSRSESRAIQTPCLSSKITGYTMSQSIRLTSPSCSLATCSSSLRRQTRGRCPPVFPWRSALRGRLGALAIAKGTRRWPRLPPSGWWRG